MNSEIDPRAEPAVVTGSREQLLYLLAEALEIERAVVGIGTDLEASVLTVLALSELGTKDIWAKALSSKHGRILERTGAHHVIYPEAAMGERVAHLVTGKMIDFIEFDDGFAIVKTRAPRESAGKTLAECALRSKYGATNVGVKRARTDFTHATPEMKIEQGDRSYFAWFDARTGDDRRHFAGPRSLEGFAAGSIAAGAPSEWFASAELVGPLASFEGADHWVAHPYRNGVALIGDAAASNDPSFGAGLSLALGDVRSLRDRLLENENWDVAGEEYAAEHDRRYEAVHRITGWIRTLFLDPRPEASAIRERALPRIAAEPSRRVDYVGLGPSAPSDNAARRRFFGED